MNVGERPLRSHNVSSGFAVGLVARVVRFLTNLILVRAIILQFGPSMWGVLALSFAVSDLIVIFDFAIHELCVYEAASSHSRQSAQRSLDQALVLCLLPIGLGTITLACCAAAAAFGIGFGAEYEGPVLTQLFVAAAVSYPTMILTKVYSGTLQGFGWVRELNFVALTGLLIDFGVVIFALVTGLGVVGIQWTRAALSPVALAIALYAVRRLGLPVARPRRPDRTRLRPMLDYAFRYNVNRGLGSAVVSCTAPIAQRFVPAAALGGFGASDQWAGKLRKFSEVAWESLFHRLVRCFRPEAAPEEREAGRLQFLASSLGMSLFLVPAGVMLILISPWLFRHWLDAQHAALPLTLLPGLVAAWALNSTGSPSTCAIMASNRFRLSAQIHAVVLAVNVVITIALTRVHGISGAVEATVIANGLLTILLSIAACRLTGASWWRWLRSNSVPYVVAIVVLAWSQRSGSVPIAVLAAATSIGMSLAVGVKARSFRSFREILRTPGSAV